MINPTPQQIREARAQAGLTQSQAAAILSKTLRTWQAWEAPEGTPMHRTMVAPLFELFLLKTKNNP